MLTIAKVLKVAYWKINVSDPSSKTIVGMLNELADAYYLAADESAELTPHRKTVAGALMRVFDVSDEDVAGYDRGENPSSGGAPTPA